MNESWEVMDEMKNFGTRASNMRLCPFYYCPFFKFHVAESPEAATTATTTTPLRVTDGGWMSTGLMDGRMDGS